MNTRHFFKTIVGTVAAGLWSSQSHASKWLVVTWYKGDWKPLVLQSKMRMNKCPDGYAFWSETARWRLAPKGCVEDCVEYGSFESANLAFIHVGIPVPSWEEVKAEWMTEGRGWIPNTWTDCKI